jgi:hypothetical protein
LKRLIDCWETNSLPDLSGGNIAELSLPARANFASRIARYFSIGFIKSWMIAIPEMQGPFVWSGTQVCDFIDSLYW